MRNILIKRGHQPGHRWPTSQRTLRARVRKKAGTFFERLTYEHVVDLREFNIPELKQTMFAYLDPVYVWIQQCEALIESGHKLVWSPKKLTHPETGEPMYGAGVEYGVLLQAATASIPEGFPALFNVTWDGGDTGYQARGAIPICVQVMNTNVGSTDSIGLVGYLPQIQIPGLPDTVRRQVKHHILQTCIGQILGVIERRARHGFKCVLGNTIRLLFPRLGAMTLDTPERVKYFGLRSMRSCGICRLRRGRSVTRKASRHDPELLRLLFGWANRPAHTRATISQRARAREKLHRHGFNYKTQCRLWQFVQESVVSMPQLPPTAYAGLIQYERMHVFFMGFCTYCTELLVQCVIPDCCHRVRATVTACHQFRDPDTGLIHPRIESVLDLTHCTAERRVRSVFYWAHVLGIQAEVVIPGMRLHAQIAVSTLQLLLIAVRGHRAYTRKELDTIFLDVGREFFTRLEVLSTYAENDRLAKGRQAHERRPTAVRPPVPFKRQRR